MIRREEIVGIGKFQKTHALKGELNMILEIAPEYFEEGNPLIIEDDGILVPYFAENIREKGSTSYLIKLVGIDSEEMASKFVNKEINILKKDAEELLDGEIIDAEEFQGYKIIDDKNGEEVGTVETIDDSTANILFLVKDEEGDILYIPANENFIVAVDDEKKIIRMNLPEGLLDLNNKTTK